MKLISSNSNIQIFIDYVYRIMKKYKCVLKVSTDDVYIDKNIVGGYFSWSDKEIVIDINSNWLETLVHEFAHLLILKETGKKENNLQYKCSGMMFSWLGGEIELTNKEINFYVDVVKKMELACEIRTVELIKQYNLPIDINMYSKCANAYVFYHDIIKKHRKWTTTMFSQMPDVLELMSTNFDMNYDIIDENIIKSFEKYL